MTGLQKRFNFIVETEIFVLVNSDQRKNDANKAFSLFFATRILS